MRLIILVALFATVACRDALSPSGSAPSLGPSLDTRSTAEVCDVQDDIGGFVQLIAECPVSGFTDNTDFIRYWVHNDCDGNAGMGNEPCIGKTVVAVYEFRYNPDGVRYGIRRVALHEAPPNATVAATIRPKFVREASAVKIVGFASECLVSDPSSPPDNETCFENRTGIHDELYYSIDNVGATFASGFDVFSRSPMTYAVDAATTNESPVASLVISQTRALGAGAPCSDWLFDASLSRPYSSRYENQQLTYTFELRAGGTLVERFVTSSASIQRQLCAGSYSVRLAIEDAAGGIDGLPEISFQPFAQNQPPVAMFSHVCDGLQCSFDGSASTDDVGITTWTWDIAGTSATGPTVSHLFTESGSYPVRLTVYDQAGQSSSVLNTVVVSAPAEFQLELSQFFSLQPNTTCTWTATISGGTPPFFVTWSKGSSLTTIVPVASGSSSLRQLAYSTSTGTGQKVFVRVEVSDATGAVRSDLAMSLLSSSAAHCQS